MAPIHNVTTIAHGNPDTLCTPSSAADIALFFFANYIAHCATVKSYPGENAIELGIAVLLALLFPSSGIIRALDSIFRHSRFRNSNELRRAARAGALCMVVRAPGWTPIAGDVITGIRKDTKRSRTKIRKFIRY